MNHRRMPRAIAYVLAFSSIAAIAVSACGNSSSSPVAVGCSLARNGCQLGCSGSLGCVQCAANSDCPNGNPVCVLGQCHACDVSSDCATGQVCEPATHNCAAPCTTNANCMGGGGPGGNNAPICDVATQTCVGCTPATVAADCPVAAGRPLCDSRMQCSECIVRTDCGVAAPACDAQTGTCVECLIDTDCTGQNACGTDHQCHPICVANADCTAPGRPVCDTAGACVQCALNTDCATNANNLHVCNVNNHTCVGCAVNADCTTPATPVCLARTGQCLECQANADCKTAALPRCNVRTGQCQACQTTADCALFPATPTCQNGICA